MWNQRVGVVAAGAMLAGCAKIFDLTPVELPEPPDAAPLDGAGEWGFSMPRPVMDLTDNALDGDPTLTSDMTEIYFKSTRAGGLGLEDIWYSTRATVSDAWAPPMRSTLSSTDNDNQPRIAPDGLTIWFRQGSGSGATIMVSTRASAKMDTLWSTPDTLSELDATSPPGKEDAAFFSTSPDVAYLMSKRSGPTLHIFRSVRQGALWGTPEPVPELTETASYEQSPWVTPDQLTIVFDSNRPGCNTGGDIWLAQRADPSLPFGVPICLGEVSDFGFESAPWISPDLRHLYFRSSASGGGDIWEAHR